MPTPENIGQARNHGPRIQDTPLISSGASAPSNSRSNQRFLLLRSSSPWRTASNIKIVYEGLRALLDAASEIRPTLPPPVAKHPWHPSLPQVHPNPFRRFRKA